jgi:hypothetical protein
VFGSLPDAFVLPLIQLLTPNQSKTFRLIRNQTSRVQLRLLFLSKQIRQNFANGQIFQSLDIDISRETASPKQLLQELSCKPARYERCMIHYPISRPIPVRPLSSRNSSGGMLMKLPPELLYILLPSLNFHSLRNLRPLNYAIKEAVDALPAYKHVVEHASTTLRTLVDTRLINQLTAYQLYGTLIKDRRVGCHDYGPYLLLPTSERCCFNCLSGNHSMRAITTSAAKKCFGLDKGSLSEICTMLSLSGEYGLRSSRHGKRIWLLSAKWHER